MLEPICLTYHLSTSTKGPVCLPFLQGNYVCYINVSVRFLANKDAYPFPCYFVDVVVVVIVITVIVVIVMAVVWMNHH